MNEGVKILLERMKTNPEEFIAPPNTGASKWGHLIESYMDSLEPEDQAALKDGYKKIHQQRFTEAVMKELLAPEEDDSLGKPWYTGHPTGTLSAGTTPTQSLVTLNNTNAVGGTWGTSPYANTVTVSSDPLVNKKPVVKKHKTLFGKLFNYS